MCFEDWAPKGLIHATAAPADPGSLPLGTLRDLRARRFKAENGAFFSRQAQAESGSCGSEGSLGQSLSPSLQSLAWGTGGMKPGGGSSTQNPT